MDVERRLLASCPARACVKTEFARHHIRYHIDRLWRGNAKAYASAVQSLMKRRKIVRGLIALGKSQTVQRDINVIEQRDRNFPIR